MRQQAESEQPRLKELVRIWEVWGFWVRAGHERQYRTELGAVAAGLSKNRAILGDAESWRALVRFAGEVKAAGAAGFVAHSLKNGPAMVRAEAATACGRIGSDELAIAVVRAAAVEADATVQQKLAMAAEEWPGRADVGAAMRALFERTESPGVRREVLFSAARANWAERGDLLAEAFDAPADGVLGAALLALAARPEAKLRDRVLALAAETGEAQPPLIDALAAYGDARAAPHLRRWLDRQENPVVRVKLLLAIERTAAGRDADDELLRVLRSDASAMVVEQCIGACARKRVAGADEVLRAMAVDRTAPMQLRVAAIFGLGRFDTPAVRRAVAELDRDADALFKDAVDADGRSAHAETVDMARMMIALAKIRLGEPDGDAKLQAAYDRGTGMSQLTALVMLAETGHDHPIIAQGLETVDTAILYGAARAATAANPAKYHDRLAALRHAPFVESMLGSGLDSANLKATLDEAIAAGAKR